MNLENEVKVRWHLSARHVHLTIIPCTKYSRTIAYSIKQTKSQKTYNHWTIKMRSWSDDTWQLDMHNLVLPYTEYTRPIAYSIWDMSLAIKT